MSSTPNPVIGLLSWDYACPKGGMGRSLQSIASTLRQGGFVLRILAPCPDNAADHPLLSFTHRVGGQMLFSLLLPFTFKHRIRSTRIDRLLLPVGPGGVMLLGQPLVPAIAIVYHSYAQQCRLVPGQSWKKIFCPLERRTLSFCDRIVCFSEDTKQALIDAYDIDPQKITLLPHSVVVSATLSVKEHGLCICVARLDGRKGVDVLLRAWPSIIAAMPDARLVIVGNGPQARIIDRMIAQTSGVQRMRSVFQHDLDLLVQRAEVAFCPAYLEGFGCACAEAMAAGCCVIASDADSLRRLIVQGESGVLIPAGDSEALAAAAIGVLSNASTAERLGQHARARMQSLHNPVEADAALCATIRSGFA